MVSCSSRTTLATASRFVKSTDQSASEVAEADAHDAPLGLFGGTFDPPHAGHVAAAQAALGQLGLRRLVVMVAGDPWQKSTCRAVTAATHRLAMTKLAFSDVASVEVSELEVRRAGPTYTIDTVRELRDKSPSPAERPSFYLIVGARAARAIDTWHRASQLASLVTLAVVQPDRCAPKVPPRWKAVAVPMKPVDVSSSRLRAELVSGNRSDELLGLIGEKTLAYIDAHGLYGPNC